MSTTIYLDVDGVINAFGPNSRRPESSGWAGEWNTVKVKFFQITYATELIEQLHALAAKDDVTIKWLTTWTDDAPKDLCPAIGLNGTSWPVVGQGENYHRDEWWKLTAIKDDVAATNPDQVIWIDDDLRMEKEALWWALDNRQVRVFAPEQFVGLTAADIAKIHELTGATQ